MRYRLIVSLLVVTACASGSTTPPPSPSPSVETVRVTSGSEIGIGMGGGPADAHVGVVEAPVADVWRVLPAVLDSLGIVPTTSDPATFQIGNTGFEIRQKLGRTMVTRYFDCGAARGGSSAMSYDLHVSLMTQLRPRDGGGTTVSTKVEVQGKPITYSGGYVRCDSMGTLEQAIVDGAVKALTH